MCSSISPDPLTARQRCQQRGVRSVLQRPALRCNARLRGGSGVRPIERLARRSKGGAVGRAAFKRSSNNNSNKQQRQQRWRPESLRRHATWDEGEQRGLGGERERSETERRAPPSGPEGTSRPAGRSGLCGWGRGAEIVHRLLWQTCGSWFWAGSAAMLFLQNSKVLRQELTNILHMSQANRAAALQACLLKPSISIPSLPASLL